jgi:hypothetical protein
MGATACADELAKCKHAHHAHGLGHSFGPELVCGNYDRSPAGIQRCDRPWHAHQRNPSPCTATVRPAGRREESSCPSE